MDTFYITTIINFVTVLIIGISAILLWRQIKENHEWNRRKATQEVLNNLVFGEFPELRAKLEGEFKCKIWEKSQNFQNLTEGLSEERTDDIKILLSRILNILEAIAINIKNNIIDEDICYDYLGWIMSEYYRWSKQYRYLQ